MSRILWSSSVWDATESSAVGAVPQLSNVEGRHGGVNARQAEVSISGTSARHESETCEGPRPAGPPAYPSEREEPEASSVEGHGAWHHMKISFGVGCLKELLIAIQTFPHFPAPIETMPTSPS